jgi:hypothetical protein
MFGLRGNAREDTVVSDRDDRPPGGEQLWSHGPSRNTNSQTALETFPARELHLELPRVACSLWAEETELGLHSAAEA